MSQKFTHQVPTTSRVSHVNFRVLTDDIAYQMATTHINSTNLTQDEAGGLFDLHLGSLSDQKQCLSCNNTKRFCQGHSGVLFLQHPYIIPQFEQYVNTILRKVCLRCHRIVSSDKKCPECKAKAPSLKMQKGRLVLTQDGLQHVLDPKKIQTILSNIDINAAKKELNIGVQPSDLISNYLFVSSPIIRPDKRIQSQFKNSDEFTVSLHSIVQQGLKLNQMTENNQMFAKLYETMCTQLANYHKGEVDKDDDGKSQQVKSISSSMMTKEGRIRANMLGKKVVNMGRAVIACDTTNPPDVITIPLEFAMSVYVRETVRSYNRERLQKVFDNGPHQYPGAVYVVKSDRKRYQVGNPSVTMEDGDVLYRHLQTGDQVLLNRQPSLMAQSICTHKIRVATKANTDTIDINAIAANPLYNADFDGDEMNLIIITNQVSLAEAQYVSTIYNRIISGQSAKIAIAQYQDSIIGGYFMTKDVVTMDRMFCIRMHQNSRIRADMRDLSERMASKDVLSMILPQINYTGKCEFFNAAYQDYIKYKPTDKQLVIELGKVKQGYFDAGAKEFQKQVVLSNDPKTALDYIFSIQQAILNFNKYHGMSVGIRDFYISPDNRQMLQVKRDAIMRQGLQIILNYIKKGQTVGPTGISRYDHLLETLSDALFDDCQVELMKIVRIDDNQVRNNLYNMALTGAKGKFSYLKSMLVYIGFMLIDNEPLKHQFQGRMNMFYKRFDLDPRSFGMILSSYQCGLSPCELLFNSVPERIQMLQKVLSVAKAGAMGRKLVKNFESIVVRNTRFARKHHQITQPLFGYDGFQVETVIDYVIPNLLDAKPDFVRKFTDTLDTNARQFSQAARDAAHQHALFVYDFVHVYKVVMINHQLVNDQYTFGSKLQIPIALQTLLATRCQQIANLGTRAQESDLLANLALLRDFVLNLKYIYFNSAMQREQAYVPALYDKATSALKIALLTAITPDKVAVFTNEQFQVLLNDIRISLMQNLVEYGNPAGVNSAQYFQEYLTQSLLNSIHKTGSGKVRKSPIDRILEIFSHKQPEQYKTPPIVRIPLAAHITKERAEYISNRLKIIKFNNVTDNWQVIYASLETPRSQFHTDSQFMANEAIPARATDWCIRVEIDKMALLIHSISIQEIKQAIQQQFDVFVYNNTEDQSTLVMRIYLSKTFAFDSRVKLREIVQKILTANVRGIAQIHSARVITQTFQTCGPDGLISPKRHFVIAAEGSDIQQVLQQQKLFPTDILYDYVTCDNTPLTYKWFGKIATNTKIINEIRTVMQEYLNVRHLYLIADEITSTGTLTVVDTEGIKERNPHNDLLQISDSRPVTTVRRSALQNKRSTVEALSANMMVGQTPDVGTYYNTISVNMDMIFAFNQQSVSVPSIVANFE